MTCPPIMTFALIPFHYLDILGTGRFIFAWFIETIIVSSYCNSAVEHTNIYLITKNRSGNANIHTSVANLKSRILHAVVAEKSNEGVSMSFYPIAPVWISGLRSAAKSRWFLFIRKEYAERHFRVEEPTFGNVGP